MKINRFVLLFSGYLLYSLVAVVAKSSAAFSLNSAASLIRYLLGLCMLVVYALLWQISLKRMSLSLAFMCKGSLVVFALFWSQLIFRETLTLFNVLGVILVIAGIVLFSTGKGQAV